MSQLVADWEQKGYEVLLFDAGDAVQGTNVVNRSKGDNAIMFMTNVGYDAMALGNHEFDYGLNKIADYTAAASFPLLAANVIVEETGKTLVEPQTIITLKDGRKVGVFGLVTPETFTKSNPIFVKGLVFHQGDKLYSCAQEQVDALRKENCDLVVCLGHLGEQEVSAPNRAQDVVAHVSGIDLFIDGHDHKEEGQGLLDASGNETLVVEADCHTHMVGIVTWEDGKLERQLVRFGEYDGQDPEIAAIVKREVDSIEEKLSQVIATTDFELNGSTVPGLRTEETNLGDLVADAVLWEGQMRAEDAPDIAIVNGGTIRSSVPVGDITLGQITAMLPFINYVCTVQVTGAQLLEALEASCSETPEELGGFPQVAGITLSVNTQVPFEKGEMYPSSTYYQPAMPESRVTIKSVNGSPFDENATYTIATSDFISAGGDTYHAFADPSQDTMKGTDSLLSDALHQFLIDACGGAVPHEYEQSQGRIVITT